jgi:acetyl esterase/lipase
MNVRRALGLAARVVAGPALALAVSGGGLWWWLHPPVERTTGVVYGAGHGRALTLDVVRPRSANGAGVVVLQSGSWKSPAGAMDLAIVAPLLRHGYTLFTVRHGSQPEFTVMEIFEEVERAVRFVRHGAPEFGVDPARMAIVGGSSGGHLSLLVATRGGPGPASAGDPVDRESSAVQAVACFYPPTDLLNLGPSTENPGDGGPPRSYVKAFGPKSTVPSEWRVIGRDLSPIYHVGPGLPPVLIVHGDSDTLVPLEQSQRFAARAAELGRPVELVVRPGKGHGWLTMFWDVRLFADWFDRQLLPGGAASEGPPD